MIRDVSTSKVLAWWDGETRVFVEPGPATRGELYIPHRWRLIHADDVSVPLPASGAPRA